MTEPITLGSYTLAPPAASNLSVSMLLWGDAAAGKTTLAATAPGTKLFIQFDPGGHLSIVTRPDVLVLDLSGENHLNVIEKFRSDNPFGIEKMLKEHPEIETIVVDSLTTLAYSAIREAVEKNKSSSLEQPGQHGYTWRNAVVLRAMTTLLNLTTRQQRNIIFTTHENSPDKDQNTGVIRSIGMALSEGMANAIALRLNEVWWMQDTGKPNERLIAVRPTQSRRPMKTRMFDAQTPTFTWRFDPINWKGDGIGTWFDTWKKGGGRKLALPK